MLAPADARKALGKLFVREKISDLHLLCETVGTGSRMSVFRRMNEMGYLTSYTDAGRYYTLERNACFESLGLWFHKCVGFSRAGTLKRTVAEFIERSPAGMRPAELRDMLRLRGTPALYNTLGGLVRAGRIERKRMERGTLYLSAKPDRAREQLERRQEKERPGFDQGVVLPPGEIIIAVLVEALQAAAVLTEPRRIEERLQAQAVSVTAKQVEQVLGHYGLESEKNTAG